MDTHKPDDLDDLTDQVQDEEIKQRVMDIKNSIQLVYDEDWSKFTLVQSTELLELSFRSIIGKYFALNQRMRQKLNSQEPARYLFYNPILKSLAERILELDNYVKKVFNNDLSNQFMRTILLYFNLKDCFSHTYMSLLHYGRDGLIIMTNEHDQPLDTYGYVIADDNLEQCLINADKRPDDRDPNLQIPALICSNLESKSKILNSYFGLKSVLEDNAIMDVNKFKEDENEEDDISLKQDKLIDPLSIPKQKHERYYSYDKNKYDGFMLGLIYKDNYTTSHIFFTRDSNFLNKLNKLVENEHNIREFLKNIDTKYNIKSKMKGFKFSGFGIGLWIGYPKCQFYFKNEENMWNANVHSKDINTLKEILLKNYNVNEEQLKDEITSIYANKFQNLDFVFQFRKKKLEDLHKYKKINNKPVPKNKIPSEQAIKKLEIQWNELLKERMIIISDNFSVVDEETFQTFFTQPWTSTNKVYKLKNKKKQSL